MNLITMTIPDNPADLVPWLEQRLMAPDFGRFAAELSALYPEPPEQREPSHLVLRAWLPRVLETGLREVPPELLQRLLRQPTTLTDLQEQLLAEGGPYWDGVLQRCADLQPAFDRGRLAVDALVGGPEAVVGPRSAPTAEPVILAGREPAAPVPGARFYRRMAFAAGGLAACLAVVVGVLLLRPTPPAGQAMASWGWGKLGGIPEDARQPKVYLEQLASTAEEWFKERPEDAPALAKRLNEFRSGCSQLILAAHQPLAPEERKWLVERCRVWAAKLDSHLVALEAGQDLGRVREAADATVKALAAALRKKAEQV
jgi:hypothetical protein